MQFTAQELKLIDRLRKQERRWPRTRWVLLTIAALILGTYAYFVPVLIGILDSREFGDATALLVAVMWPKILLGLCVAPRT